MEKEKRRLQFDFTEEAVHVLDQLQKLTGLPNRAEVIRQAVRCFQWIAEETVKNKGTVMLEKEGRIREVIFPFLVTTPAAGQTNAEEPKEFMEAGARGF
jgi:hypothetical protein